MFALKGLVPWPPDPRRWFCGEMQVCGDSYSEPPGQREGRRKKDGGRTGAWGRGRRVEKMLKAAPPESCCAFYLAPPAPI